MQPLLHAFKTLSGNRWYLVRFLTMLWGSLTAAAGLANPPLEPNVNEAQIGVGYVSDDSFRFGRYTGLKDQGAYLIGHINARNYWEEGYNFGVTGTNLGLDSRYLHMDGGKQGSHEYFIEYQKLPNYINDTGATPFNGAGGSELTLPPGFDINTNLSANLKGLELETERERYGLGALLTPQKFKNWNFRVNYQRETNQGVNAIGGAIGGGFPGLTDTTTAAILPEPIDTVTDNLDVVLGYAKGKAQLELAYHFSLFDNEDRSLDWQDPFTPSTLGSLALPPRNQFHQVTMTGGYQLPKNSRLTGVLSVGRMTQDWNFQPGATSPPGSTPPLPRSALDGEVWLTSARIDLTSRPKPKLRLKGSYRYQERDNDTPSDTYTAFIADSATPSLAANTNRPLSYTRQRLEFSADYRASQMISLAGNLGYNDVEREYDDIKANNNDEYLYGAKLRLQPYPELETELYAERAKRDVSNYSNTPGIVPDAENPALRYFYLADRDRDRLGLKIGYTPYENIAFGFSVDYSKDKYDDSVIGLTEARTPRYSWDLSYTPRSNITTYVYYTFENIKSDQEGSELGLPASDWSADFEDRFISLGVGGVVRAIRGKLDLGADYVFSKSTGQIDLNASPEVSSAQALGQYPDLETSLNSFKVYGRYQYSEAIALKLSFWYQKFDADSWAIDDVSATSVPDILLLGVNTQDYDVVVVDASVAYRF